MAAVAALVGGLGVTAAAPAGAAAKPARGGEVAYGLEAETAGGWCLPSSQLAASGIQVSTAIYDSLTVINSKGKYVPFLAKSVTPNATYDQWTIALRPGVTFHDGTPVDAAAVKLNLDAWRGLNPVVRAPLLSFVFANIANVTAPDAATVVVATKTPWPSFPAQIAGGRFGIAAPAQLANASTCASNLIGSGPFKFVEWRVNERLVVDRNPSYWREGLPYLDRITFRPVPDSAARMTQFEGGELDVIQTSSPESIVKLREGQKQKKDSVIVLDQGSEVAYVMLNASKAPFDDPVAREAALLARDVKKVNTIRNLGLNTLADGPFGPGTTGYLADPGVSARNLKKAKKLVAEYTATHGGPPNYEYVTTNDPANVAIAELVKEQSAEAGITVTIRTIDQTALINNALAGTYQAMGFRNHPGGDPDTQYVWWKSDSPLNFGKFKDPEIDRLLDAGRVETDPAKRKAIYEDLNRRFAEQNWNLWSWYTLWAVGAQKNVHGIEGAPLPDGQGEPYAVFGGVIPVSGLWVKGG